MKIKALPGFSAIGCARKRKKFLPGRRLSHPCPTSSGTRHFEVSEGKESGLLTRNTRWRHARRDGVSCRGENMRQRVPRPTEHDHTQHSDQSHEEPGAHCLFLRPGRLRNTGGEKLSR